MNYYQTAQQTINICGYTFEGPYTNTNYLRDASGIYVILDKRGDGKWYVLDVGESGQIKTRIDNHDRKNDWTRSSSGTLGAAILYTSGWSDQQRRNLESEIRDAYNPPCGER